MNLRRMSARIAVAGVSSALVAGGLVAATGVAANAETKTTQYNCTVAGQTLPVAVTVSADLPVSSWQTHAAAPGGIPISYTLTLPAEVVAGLKSFGIDKVGLANTSFGLALGSASIPLTGIEAPRTDLPASGAMNITPSSVLTGGFTAPDAGEYMISMPSSFTTDVLAHNAGGDGQFPAVPCAIDAAADPAIVPFTVTKQSATISAKNASGKKGKTVSLPVAVKGSSTTATGKVLGKVGTKTFKGTLKKGKTTLALKGLKPGKNKVTLSYAGDKNTIAAAPIKVTVTIKK